MSGKVCLSADAFSSGRCHLPLLHPYWSITVALFSGVCVILTLIALRSIKMHLRICISDAKHVPTDLINYVIPYVVSFMGIDFGSISKLAGFGVFYFWMYWITFRSGQIIMNPLLVVFGWRLFEIRYRYLQSEDVFTGRVLARLEIEPGQTYRKSELQDIMIVKNGD